MYKSLLRQIQLIQEPGHSQPIMHQQHEYQPPPQVAEQQLGPTRLVLQSQPQMLHHQQQPGPPPQQEQQHVQFQYSHPVVQQPPPQQQHQVGINHGINSAHSSCPALIIILLQQYHQPMQQIQRVVHLQNPPVQHQHQPQQRVVHVQQHPGQPRLVLQQGGKILRMATATTGTHIMSPRAAATGGENFQQGQQRMVRLLTLRKPDGSTVVRPEGYSLAAQGSNLRVLPLRGNHPGQLQRPQQQQMVRHVDYGNQHQV